MIFNNINPSPTYQGTPIVKISLGKIGSLGGEVFQSGDGKLIKASVQLAEGKTQSNCSFSVYDPDKKLVDKFLSYIESVDGLDPIEQPLITNTPSVDTSTVAPALGNTGNYTQDASLPNEIRAFLDAIHFAENDTTKGYETGGYNLMFSGVTFSSYADHPRRRFTIGNNITTAAGRYQFIDTTWDNVKRQLKLPDFSPVSQDRAAVQLIKERGAYNDIIAGRISSAITKLNGTGPRNNLWSSLPGGGQQRKTLTEFNTFYQQRLAAYKQLATTSTAGSKLDRTNQAADNVKKNNINKSDINPIDSINNSKAPKQESVPNSSSLAGAQITIELGFDGQTIAASSFIHTGLKYSLFDPDILEFTGQAATWVLTQRVKNAVYTNITFKKVAEKITSAYGLKLDMPEEGPKYEYFPQRGVSDYEALLIEARRIGYRVHIKGATLSIKPRDKVIANKEVFTFIYGENMGTSFQVNHQAQRDTTGGARSSEPGLNNSTGERKFEVDPDSGKMIQKRLENVVGTGDSGDASTTGSTTPTPKPNTEGSTDAEDADRKANEDRIKGITASTEFPTTPEALTLDPDTPFLTKGISAFLDRMWVVESVTHNYDLGKLTTSIDCYSPLKNKNQSAEIVNGGSNSQTTLAPDGTGVVTPSSRYIIPAKGKYTSPFGMRRGRMHSGIDIGNNAGTPIVAAASGTVTSVVNGCRVGNQSCGGRYGNHIIINHPNGDQTVYAHNTRNLVQVGDVVTQGQQIATMGNTGYSFGNHLHWEVRRNGNRINPGSVVKLPPVEGTIF